MGDLLVSDLGLGKNSGRNGQQGLEKCGLVGRGGKIGGWEVVVGKIGDWLGHGGGGTWPRAHGGSWLVVVVEDRRLVERGRAKRGSC